MATIPGNGRIGSVTFTERVDRADPGASPIESMAQDNSRAIGIYDVPWTKRVDAAKLILGFNETDTGYVGGAAGFMKRYSPWAHPDWTLTASQREPGSGDKFLFASAIEQIHGIGKPADSNFKSKEQTNVYNIARMTVLFQMQPFRIVESKGAPSDESKWSAWITRDFRVSGEYLSVPGGAGMKFVTGPHTQKPVRLVGVRPGKILPKYDLRVTWHRLPAAAIGSVVVNPNYPAATLGAIDNAIGKVNQGTFNGFPAATLLFLGGAIKAYRWGVGNQFYDVEFLFTFNPNGMNKVPYLSAANTFGFVEISTDGVTHDDNNPQTGKHTFDNADFSQLFKAPY